VRSFEASYRSAPIARIAADVIDRFKPDAAHVHHLTCLSTEIPSLLASRGVPVLLTLHDYWLLCHRGQLLDMNYRACAGPLDKARGRPEPSGCGACVGVMAGAGPSLLAPALRAADRRLERQRLDHMRSVCGHVTRFLAPSRSIRDRFIQFGIEPERIELSPSGLDLSWRVEPASAFAKATADGPYERHRPIRIGFLGTLMVSKAPHVLLEAFSQLPSGMASVDLLGAPADYHGETAYRDVLAPLLTLPGVRSRGPQTREGVRAALASLDVVVVPSIWPETTSIVMLEAFLTGIPVVASNIGAIPEWLEHERNGLLFEPGDVDGLRRALMRLVEEPGLLDRLKAGAAATPVRSLDDDVAATRLRFAAAGHRDAPASDAPKRLAAVVLNYRTAADTAIAVASLMASDRPPDEVIVVDNDAGLECRESLARWGNAVSYVQTGGNLGFAGGMNVGIRQALSRGAGLVLLVNSDVVIPPDCVGKLESALAADQRAGIAGPLILSRSWPRIVGSHGIDYNRRTGRMRHRGAGATRESGDGGEGGCVDAVSGCVMLVAREVFDRAGLLDERYFFSFEEIDFCLRARAAGFGTRLASDAVAYHEGSQAIGRYSSRRFYFAARNHLFLAAAHANGDGGATRTARALFITALNVAHAIKSPGGSLGARVGATLRGIGDHVRGRYGADAGRGPV
jgi:GT2 family glycosyltransferase/glycosyltransferase involved in cell wall biosynthesis